MAENMIKFLRGNVANLPQTATAGAVYFTKDEGLYLGLEDGSYHRYGDFITVANVDALPSTGAHETCMYYCESENILAKWDGAEWVQINKQKTLEQLGGVAKSVYEAKMAALEKADSDNATAIEGVDTRLKAAEKKLESVATTEGLGELTERVTTAEGDIDKLEASLAEGGDTYKAIADAAAAAKAAQDTADTKATMAEVEAKNYATKDEAKAFADAKDEAIAAAKAAGDAAAELAGTKATMAEVNEAIAGAGHAVKADVDTAIENLGKAYVAADEALETKLQGNIDKKVDQTAYNTKVGELVAEDERLAGLISDNADAIAAIEEDYLTSADKEALQTQINTIMNNPDTEGVINSITEFTQYIEEHGEIAEGFRTDIDANAQAIEDLEGAVAGTYETKADATSKLTEAKGYTDTKDQAMDARVKVLEGINHDAYKAADETVLSGAKAYTDEKDSAMDTRVKALEAIDHEHANKAELDLIASGDKAKWDAAAAKAHEHANSAELAKIADGDVAKWNAAQANAEATAASALASAKTELEGKITASETAAKTYADGLKTTIDAAYAAADASLKTELQGYADTAESDAIATANAYTDSVLTWGSF